MYIDYECEKNDEIAVADLNEGKCQSDKEKAALFQMLNNQNNVEIENLIVNK